MRPLPSLSGVLAAVLFLIAPLYLVAPVQGSDQNGLFPQAVHLLNNGMYFEAAAVLETHLENHPGHEAAHLQLARALYHLKRNTEAAHRAAEVLRINPENHAAKRLLTQLRIALGRELDTTDPQAVLAYAQLCKHTDSYGRAAAFYERYLVFHPEDFEARIDLARLLNWSGRFERSAHHYGQCVDHEPDNLVVRYEYAKVLNSSGRFSDAISHLETCLSAEPEREDILLDLARSCWWGGQSEDRVDLFRKTIEVDTQELDDLKFLVLVSRRLNLPDAEYLLYERILALDPEDRRAAENKSAYDDSQAMETLRLRKVVAGDPDNPEPRRALVQHFIRAEKLGEALGELKHLSRNDPVKIELSAEVEELRRVVGQRTVALLKKMKHEVRDQEQEKIDLCQRWLEKNPEDLRTRSVLAYHLSAGQQAGDAAQQYRVILRTFPTVNPTIAERVKQLEAKRVVQP